MVLGFLILFALYWTPTIVAVIRKSPSAMAIAALNFFLGWTVIGWIIAFVWSLAAIPPAPPHVTIINN
jgi:hypothetical protein